MTVESKRESIDNKNMEMEDKSMRS